MSLLMRSHGSTTRRSIFCRPGKRAAISKPLECSKHTAVMHSRPASANLYSLFSANQDFAEKGLLQLSSRSNTASCRLPYTYIRHRKRRSVGRCAVFDAPTAGAAGVQQVASVQQAQYNWQHFVWKCLDVCHMHGAALFCLCYAVLWVRRRHTGLRTRQAHNDAHFKPVLRNPLPQAEGFTAKCEARLRTLCWCQR